jgi:pimeloyl-ACP methyl ester carboxylesterase
MVLASRSYGEGPAVVLLPWFSLSHAAMAAACEPALADSGWRRLYLDLPGTGGSAPVAPRSDAVADAVAQAIDALAGPAPVALAGCSYGGYLAAALASRTPDRVAGLLLICSGVRIRPAERNLSGVLPSDPEAGWLDDVPERLREHFELAVGHQTRAVADRVATAFRVSGQGDERYLAELRSTGFQLTDERSVSLKTVAAVLAGRRDRIAGFRDQFELAVTGRAADFMCLDSAGHYLPFEEPERFAGIALDWLARCRVAGRAA